MANGMRKLGETGNFPTGKSPARHLWVFDMAMSITGLLAVTLMIFGPIASNAYIEAAPGHSHVYLTPGAATDHEHGASDAQAHDGVLSVPDRSGRAQSIALEIVLAEQWLQEIRLPTFLQLDQYVGMYSNAFVIPPERPPRYA